MKHTSRRLSAAIAAAALSVAGLGYAPADAADTFDPTAPIDLSAADYDVSATAPLAISPDETTAFIAGDSSVSVIRAINLTTGARQSRSVDGAIYNLIATATGVYFSSNGSIWSWDGHSDHEFVHYASPEAFYGRAFTVVDGHPVVVGSDPDGDIWTWQPQSDGGPSGVSELTYVPKDAQVTDLAFVAGQSQPIVIGQYISTSGGGMWAPHASAVYPTYTPSDLLATTDHQVLVSGGGANVVHAYTFDAAGRLTQTVDGELGTGADQMTLGRTPGSLYISAGGAINQIDVSKFPAYTAGTASANRRWLGDTVDISSVVASTLTSKIWYLDRGNALLTTLLPPITSAPAARATVGDPHSLTVSWDATDPDLGAQVHTITATPLDAPAAVKPVSFRVQDWANCTTAASRTTCVVGSAPRIAAATLYEVTVTAADEFFAGPAVSTGSNVRTSPPFVGHPTAFAISGTARVGNKLSIAPTRGAWPRGAVVTYTWALNGSPFATGTSITLTAKQRRGYIGVAAKATLAGFTPWEAFAAELRTPVADVLRPVKVAKAPKVSGTAKVGKKLTVTKPKTVTGATIRYQWLRNGASIKGATKTTYKVSKKDKKKVLSVRVTVTKAGTLPYVKVIRIGKIK